MCIAFVAYDAHPAILLLLAFNRDEFHDRPTAPCTFWSDHPHVIAGRDLQRCGTWLGATDKGRVALLTNFREARADVSATSRGALTVDFLTGADAPLDYLQDLAQGQYAGFNLLVADLVRREVAYCSNRSPEPPCVLQPGCYGLSNGLLGQWPKVSRGLDAFKSILSSCSAEGLPLPWDRLFDELLCDNTPPAGDEHLPQTGVGLELERRFCPIFVDTFQLQGSPYGTRSQTLLAVWRDGRTELHERSVAEGGSWRLEHHHFSMPLQRGATHVPPT